MTKSLSGTAFCCGAGFRIGTLVFMAAVVFAGCTPRSISVSEEEALSLELRVVSSFSGTDGNRAAFEQAYRDWEVSTGNKVIDESQTSDESWKAKVVADFETGSEPGVLFFFTGVDAASFIEAGKVVSLDEIQAVYPGYGSNMSAGKLSGAASTVDNNVYVIPTSGYWEGLFANTAVLAECGVELPGSDTSWDEFLAICQKILDAGYVPIACSLQQIPHYWFEFCIMNSGGSGSHLEVPRSETDAAFNAWAEGLSDIRELYRRGFLSPNTLSASDDEIFQAMYDGEAAFALDGSWKTNQIIHNVPADRIGDYTVTFVPAKGPRRATDLVGGLSMGYYITRKAWNNPAMREAAVSFVQAMTTDEVINTMAAGTAQTALADPAPKPDGLNSLQEAAFEMMQKATSVTPAVQDFIKPEA
ncbi:MAG: extracellular solute-binding protein, partial [Spirochaetaceae bacterium]|nr:extracellular solute-binding protein [Spirochaetaceae bacterium]